MLSKVVAKLNRKIQSINPDVNLSLKDDCALLTGSSHNWDEIVMIGRMVAKTKKFYGCLLYTSPSPRDRTRSRMPSSA